LEPLWQAVRQVWASAFNVWAAAYGASGSASTPVWMAVVIQELVDPRASGVVFSMDPVSGARDTTVVSAVYGLGEGLVSGELDADTYHVRFGARDPQIRSSVARKTHAVRLGAHGRTGLEEVAENLQTTPALADADAIAIADAARELEHVFG